MEIDECKTVYETYQELWPGWKTVRLIGQGSYGAVYEIRREDKGVVESAALKVISIPREGSEVAALRSNGMDDASITNWFDECMQDMLKEYGCMRDMKGHTNIVYCDDFNTVKHEDGLGWDIYIKMELLTALTEVLKDKDLSENEIIQLGKDICKALIVCKSKNVVHRDIKPQNIFVSQDGDYKLGDFGVSIVSDHTTRAQTAGSYRYMAPEVYYNKPYGSKSDIYSLGLVMFWLLNQRRSPFEPNPPKPVTKSDADKARNRRFEGEVLPPPCNGSDELKRIVLKACKYNPEDRYQSAEEMLNDLENMSQTKKLFSISKKVIGVAAGVVLLIGIAVSGILKLTNDQDQTVQPPAQTVEEATVPTSTTVPDAEDNEESPLVYDSETMYRIILTASDEMSVKEFNGSVATVQERLDVLTGGEEYGFQVYEDTVELLLPKACLHGVDVENALMCYISRPTELWLADPETMGWLGTAPTKIELSRLDIDSIVLKNGSIEGIDPAEHGISQNTYPYVEIKLSEPFAEEIAQEIPQWSGVVLAQDMSFSSFFYMDILLQEDGRTLHVLNSDIEGHFLETMVYNYSHDPLPDAFYYTVEPQVTWLDPSETLTVGKNQCCESELNGKSVMVIYTSYSLTDTQSGDWIDACAALQARLDTLDQPYSIGYITNDDGIEVVYKTKPERLSRQIMNLMGSTCYSVTVRLGLKQESFSLYSDDVCSIVENEDGTICYEIDFTSNTDNIEKLQEFTKSVKNPTELALVISDIPLLSTVIEAPITDGKLVFQTLYPNDHAAIQESNIWFVNLVDSILNGKSLSSLYYDSSVFGMDENGEMASESDFGISYQSNQEEISQIIANHAPDATVSFSDNQISVFLHLNVDETLPRTAADLVKEIYKNLDFENRSYDTLAFYLIDENNEMVERARIFFRKDYYDGRVEVNGIFKNGRLDRYSYHFLYIVENTPFYYQKADDSYGLAWDC